MRIIFIPGLGEEVSIFDKIQASLPQEKVFIDNWKWLGHLPEKGLNALVYAKYLVEQFEIKEGDVILGHSMGGWIGWYIKHLVGCRLIQVASWTDSSKIIKVPLERHLMYWLAKRGIGFNTVALRILVWLHYKNKPSKEIFIEIFERLRRGDKEIVAKQLMVIFNPVKIPVNVAPDVRIHAKADHIVKYPSQTFHEVPGDHFSLVTHPKQVYKPITNFLKAEGVPFVGIEGKKAST
ncbi:alpha/beta fold hydrolase [Segetibacter koreensis]|uniref:alpha/beta fold hydrolase n=1 Tax=Segetibacter koreensis TaxID=398037 RepID=UPI0003660906|nr:alpha/beta hydrolase [Segetibacter koreensis]